MKNTLLDKERDKKIIQKMKNKKKSTKTVPTSTIRNQLNLLETKMDEYFDDTSTYKAIFDQQELYDYLSEDIYGMDTESNIMGSNIDPIDDEFVGMGLYSPKKNKAIYVPIAHQKTHLIRYNYQYDYNNQMTLDELAEVMKEVNVKYILHNAPYDMRVLLNSIGYVDWDSLLWDTWLGGWYLCETEPHGLKELYDKYVVKTEESLTFKELFKEVDFQLVPIELAKNYGGKDPLMTYKLYEFQKEFLKVEGKYTKDYDMQQAGKFYLDWELPLAKTTAKMEERGFKFDSKQAKKTKKKYEHKRTKIEEQLHNIIDEFDLSKLPSIKMQKLGNPVNISSDSQIRILMFDVLELDYEKRTSAEDALKYFKNKLEGQQQKFFELLLEHRSLDKIISNYLDQLPKQVKENGKLHSNLNQVGTVTGRYSSSNPNLQNISSDRDDIRKLFCADPGKILICSDYSQQEVRILAYYADDEKMKQAYREGKDLYSTIASSIYNAPYETCLKGGKNEPYRTESKTIILGKMFGRSIASIASQINKSYRETQKILQDFYNLFPSIKTAIDKAVAFCEEHGYVKTIYGTKRRLPDINLKEYQVDADKKKEQYYLKKLKNASYTETQRLKEQAEAEDVHIQDNTGFIAKAKRQAINSIIQGSAACMTKKALVLIENNQRLHELGYELLLPVHDEVIGQVTYDARVKESIDIVEKLMIKAGRPVDITMEVDHAISKKWYGEEITI